MSGIEIAGILLTALPIAANWLEHYREVLEMLGCWRRFRSEYRKAETQFQMLELSLNLTLENLFLPHVESLDKMKQLTSDSKRKLCAEAEDKLRQRLLPEVYEVYTKLFQDLQDAILHLEKTLGYDKESFRRELSTKSGSVDNPQKLPTITKMQLRSIYEIERVKFSTGEKSREAAVRRVEDILRRLDGLLVMNDKTATNRAVYTANVKVALQSTLLYFWRDARAIYDLLSRTWSCGCRQWHRADLLLFHRTEPEVALDVLFHYALPSPASCPWSALSTQICKVELPKEPKPNSKVRFSISRRLQSSQTSELLPINDLCTTFQRLKKGRRNVGLLTGARYESGYSLTKREQTPNPPLVTLGDLLRLNTWERPQRKQRYRIAATIASSHLQLHSSGWLQGGWNKDEIAFSLNENKTNFDRIYLRKGFHDVPSQANAVSIDIAFATLGILLLELCFGFNLEESPFRQQYLLPDGNSDLVQDHLAAWEWAKKVEGEADERWAHAIDWCLGKRRVREDDSAWRQDFYRVVVEPLRAEAAPVSLLQ